MYIKYYALQLQECAKEYFIKIKITLRLLNLKCGLILIETVPCIMGNAKLDISMYITMYVSK